MRNNLIKNLKLNPKSDANYSIKNGDDEATIYVYDVIDDYYGVSAEQFVKDLNEIDAKTVNIRINSPGGDVFGARAMQTAMMQSEKTIVAHVDGVAASAATFLAMGADEIRMTDGAFFMIHNAWTLAIGNAQEMRELADFLDKVDGSIANDYAKKTGENLEDVKALMSAETWFTAAEAKDIGLVDEIVEGKKAKNTFNLDVYSSVPEQMDEKEGETDDKELKNAQDCQYEHNLRVFKLLENAA